MAYTKKILAIFAEALHSNVEVTRKAFHIMFEYINKNPRCNNAPLGCIIEANRGDQIHYAPYLEDMGRAYNRSVIVMSEVHGEYGVIKSHATGKIMVEEFKHALSHELVRFAHDAISVNVTRNPPLDIAQQTSKLAEQLSRFSWHPGDIYHGKDNDKIDDLVIAVMQVTHYLPKFFMHAEEYQAFQIAARIPPSVILYGKMGVYINI